MPELVESAGQECDGSRMWRNIVAIPFLATLVIGCDNRKTPETACTPPLASWLKPHPHLGPDIPLVYVSLDRNGAVYFGGKKTTLDRLPSDLKIVPEMGEPEPAIIFETEMGAPCETLNKVRSIMNERLKCDRGGHCDEGVQTIWRDLPYDGPGVP